MSKKLFTDFSVGDSAIFKRAFSQDEVCVFSELSGDMNSYHIDQSFAEKSRFRKTIVPFQLLISPFSKIAGMILPGKPSLFLKQESEVLQPVFPDDKLVYSARIESISHVKRILTLRILVMRGHEVVLTASMLTQAQEDSWEQDVCIGIEYSPASSPRKVLVTGGSGEIGFAVATELARRGCVLILQDRGNAQRRAVIAGKLTRFNSHPVFCAADFEKQEDVDSLIDFVASSGGVDMVFHAASAGLSKGPESLIKTNYHALRRLGDAFVPEMLSRQRGSIVFISSAATEQGIFGMEDYSAVKAMASNYVMGLDKNYSLYGVRGLVIMPALVKTDFSKDLPLDQSTALMPGEVAEKAVEFAMNPNGRENTLLIDASGARRGRLGFHEPAANAPAATRQQASDGSQVSPSVDSGLVANQTDSVVANVLRTVLSLPASVDLNGAALGVTPGWDSLRHIELIVTLEKECSITFSVPEIQETTRFDSLKRLLEKKTVEHHEKNA